jgi:hypothetical protein
MTTGVVRKGPVGADSRAAGARSTEPALALALAPVQDTGRRAPVRGADRRLPHGMNSLLPEADLAWAGERPLAVLAQVPAGTIKAHRVAGAGQRLDLARGRWRPARRLAGMPVREPPDPPRMERGALRSRRFQRVGLAKGNGVASPLGRTDGARTGQASQVGAGVPHSPRAAVGVALREQA